MDVPAGIAAAEHEQYQPLIVIDAGRASQGNLEWLRSKNYKYLCVSRVRVKDFKAVKEEGKPVVMNDKRGSPIEMLLIVNLINIVL
jgi:hypothetical protein